MSVDHQIETPAARWNAPKRTILPIYRNLITLFARRTAPDACICVRRQKRAVKNGAPSKGCCRANSDVHGLVNTNLIPSYAALLPVLHVRSCRRCVASSLSSSRALQDARIGIPPAGNRECCRRRRRVGARRPGKRRRDALPYGTRG